MPFRTNKMIVFLANGTLKQIIYIFNSKCYFLSNIYEVFHSVTNIPEGMITN